MESVRSTRIGATLILGLSLAGCEGMIEPPASSPTAGEPQVFVNTNREVLTGDPSVALPADTLAVLAPNALETQISTCYTAPITHGEIYCSVSDGYVLVGGGAWADWSGKQPDAGAFLIASHPVNDGSFTTWRATSKDHGIVQPHILRAYAIGIRMQGVTPAKWRSRLIIKEQNSLNTIGERLAIARLPSPYKLIGGGARANYSGDGALLTSSYPEDATTWRAAAKHHVYTDDSHSVTAFAIGFWNGNILNQPFIEISLKTGPTAESVAASRVAQSFVGVDPGWSLTSGGGGGGSYNAWGRPLFMIAPGFNASGVQSVDARNRECLWEAPGVVTSFLVQVRKL
jgi:hypothetical protein